jgi:hypothetical protein
VRASLTPRDGRTCSCGLVTDASVASRAQLTSLLGGSKNLCKDAVQCRQAFSCLRCYCKRSPPPGASSGACGAPGRVAMNVIVWPQERRHALDLLLVIASVQSQLGRINVIATPQSQLGLAAPPGAGVKVLIKRCWVPVGVSAVRTCWRCSESIPPSQRREDLQLRPCHCCICGFKSAAHQSAARE